jgi:hypothetical protein
MHDASNSVSNKVFGYVANWLHRVLLKKSVATEYLPPKKLPKFWHM